MLALQEKGLTVGDLASDKMIDLRESVGCWLSKPLSAALQNKLHFRQLLCFEPGQRVNDPGQVVGNIFRCLNNFVFDSDINSIAMPVIASGYQKVPLEKMLPVLIDNARFWLSNGLPLDFIKIVVHRSEHVTIATEIFRQRSGISPTSNGEKDGDKPEFPPGADKGMGKLHRQENAEIITGPPARPAVSDPVTSFGFGNPGVGFDYFISYAHTQSSLIQHFVDLLLKHNPKLKIFYDKSSIPAGGLWLRQISDAIAKARKVLIFLSPDYSGSMVCWDEFQCAKLIEYNSKAPVIQTIYLTSDPALPPIMGIHSYIDCREADLEKLAAACNHLLN